MSGVKKISVFVGDSFPSNRVRNSFFLQNESWDDFSFITTFCLYFFNDVCDAQKIGNVKIAKKELPIKERPLSYGRFSQLDDEYFSLGQDKSYYSNLQSLPSNYGDLLLTSTNDISYTQSIWLKNKDELSLQESLMRDISALDVISFGYVFNGLNDDLNYCLSFNYKRKDISFAVNNKEPYQNANIHALIGNNGVGKTTVLKSLASKISKKDLKCKIYLEDERLDIEDGIDISYIERVLYVSFSAFDNNLPDIVQGYNFDYIGLYNSPDSFKRPDELNSEFENAIETLVERKPQYLFDVFEPLRNVDYLCDHIDRILDNFNDLPLIMKIYQSLSSGHKIVLHTLVLLMNKLRQGVVTLFDEPETHLHPPLLGAFLQSLQIICNRYNGLLIFATHSPIILQEILASNVYVLRRVDDRMLFDRPHVNTYGQNLSKLTRTAFGYQNVGFHKVMKDLVTEKIITKDNIGSFSYIGSEAKKIAWGQLYRSEDE